MSDTSSTGDQNSGKEIFTEERKSLLCRVAFMLVFWFISNLAFSLAIFLGFVQFVVVAVTGGEMVELKRFHRNLVQYIWHCLAYIGFMRDDKPFPIGRFPNVGESDDAAREPKADDTAQSSEVTRQ